MTSSMVESVRWRRLRWRLRGAWQWPAFIVLTLVDVVLVARLPFQGEGADAMGAFLVAGFFNLLAVAVQDAEAVGRGHRPGRARRDGFLAEAVIEAAGDLALAIERHRALFDAAHHQHRAQKTRSVLRGEVLGYVRR